MAGIYIHVPFCKKKCLYCDFYSMGVSNKTEMFHLQIEKELSLRKNFILNERIDTIYFGGGTPSLLEASQIDFILKSISKKFAVSVDAEITIEVNPDDVSSNLIKAYCNSGINRVSIGIQSFLDDELNFMGRRHNAYDAEKSIETCLKNGLDNISIDLIYGTPNSTLSSWEYSLKKAFSLDIKHLSCYHLTYEEGTPLTRKLLKKVFSEVDETTSVNQFNLLQSLAKTNEFIYYEVSNLAKEGYYSRHNTSYWKDIPYLGLGPAAHSYNGSKREWNPSSYNIWTRGIELENPSLESEILDEVTKFNERILTHLRTIWGLNLPSLKLEFNQVLINQMLKSADYYIKTGKLVIVDDYLKIPTEHFFTSDKIIEDLIIVED